jgi:hypothetical protein
MALWILVGGLAHGASAAGDEAAPAAAVAPIPPLGPAGAALPALPPEAAPASEDQFPVAKPREAAPTPALAPAPKKVAAPPRAAKPAPAPAPTAAAPRKTAPATPITQVSGRVMHSWYEKPGLKIILVIDGFTIITNQEQITARDGVIWFDEDEAKKTGKIVLGVYAETGVEYRHAGGQIDKYDSVYTLLEGPGELTLVSEEPMRGKADDTELYLRAKKLRKEYVAGGVRESPTAVVPAPPPAARPPALGVKEAGIPQELKIIPQNPEVQEVPLTSFVDEETGMQVTMWTGGVYLIRGELEMACDNLVIWTPADSTKKATGLSMSSAKPAPKPAAAPKTGATASPAASSPAEKPIAVVSPAPPVEVGAAGQSGGAAVSPPAAKSGNSVAVEAYLEGNVRINYQDKWMHASQVFYDFSRDQALAINSKMHMFATHRNVPVYIYAKEVRQVAKGIFVNTDTWMTTCEFAEPHHDLYAKKMTIQELTPAPETPGENVQYHRIRFLGEDVEMEVMGYPLTYWPRMAGDVTEADTALRSIRIGNSSRRGFGVATQWHLLKLLGVQDEPPGYDFLLDLDAWTKRGPAAGVEVEYTRPTYYGQFLSYFLPDDLGIDHFNGQNVTPPTQRGRATWRHRAFLPDDWELTVEASYISDPTFLNEYFRKEDLTGKAQETLVYLKKQEQEQAFWLMASTRVEDFYTRTEYLPQVGYKVIGHSLWDDKLTYYQDSEASLARYLPSRNSLTTGSIGIAPANSQTESPMTFILDTIHEVDMPLKAGVVNVVPFVSGRLSYFSNSVDGGGKVRVEAQEGVRLSTQAWKTYNDVESEFWDLHRLRHLNIFDMTVYASQINVHSRELYPFAPTEDGTQEVVGVDGQGAVQLGWRQRFQTKRGLPDQDGKQESVDFLTTDLEATFYSNRTAPNIGPDTGPEFNNIDFRTHWRTTDVTSLWSETLYNLDASRLEKFDIGVLITHTPRLSYTVGQRIIPQGNSSITFFGIDYQLSEKWRISLLEQYDWSRKTNAHSDIVLTRRLHRWLMRIKISRDPNTGQGTFAGVEFQPIGIKEVKLSW